MMYASYLSRIPAWTLWKELQQVKALHRDDLNDQLQELDLMLRRHKQLLATAARLPLDILDVVTRFEIQDTVQVEACLELANHEIVLGICLDTFNGELANPRLSLAG